MCARVCVFVFGRPFMPLLVGWYVLMGVQLDTSMVFPVLPMLSLFTVFFSLLNENVYFQLNYRINRDSGGFGHTHAHTYQNASNSQATNACIYRILPCTFIAGKWLMWANKIICDWNGMMVLTSRILPNRNVRL